MITTTLAFLATPGLLMAHTGSHEGSATSVLFHYLTQPDHLLILAGGAALGFGAAWLAASRRSKDA